MSKKSTTEIEVVQPNGKFSLAWEPVRYWLASAFHFERAKIFSQVMAGLELISLHKKHAITNGGDRKSESVSHSGKLIRWEEIMEHETGLPRSTGYRFMDMAKAALPRIKKFDALKDFDPFDSSPKLLPPAQKEALESVVHKLTDGKTQAEFCEAFGAWKNSKSGAKGRKPGEGGRKRIPLEEQNELRRKEASEDWFHPIDGVACQIYVYGVKFTILTDAEIDGQIDILERALNARKTWLKTPIPARDVDAVEKIIKGKKQTGGSL